MDILWHNDLLHVMPFCGFICAEDGNGAINLVRRHYDVTHGKQRHLVVKHH